MADLEHRLRFTVEAGSWTVAERHAANRIRSYTREAKTGRDKSTDEQVLRDAVFTATPKDGSATLWTVDVEVTV